MSDYCTRKNAGVVRAGFQGPWPDRKTGMLRCDRLGAGRDHFAIVGMAAEPQDVHDGFLFNDR